MNGVRTFTWAAIAWFAGAALIAQPATLHNGTDALALAGRATRSRLFGLVDIYGVALYVPQGRATIDSIRSARVPVALRVEILYNGSLPDEIPSKWREELMPELGSAQQQSLTRAYARLESGDVIEIRFAPGRGTTVSVSGTRVLADKGFGLMAAFLSIWIGQTAVSEEIKSELLGSLRGGA